MYRRIFTSLIVVFASASLVAVPVATGLPLSASNSNVAPGSIDPWQQNLNARVRYEKAQRADSWMRNLFVLHAYRPSSTKHPTPGPTEPASATRGVDWTKAEIGAGVALVILLIGTASVVTIRRYNPPIAH